DAERDPPDAARLAHLDGALEQRGRQVVDAEVAEVLQRVQRGRLARAGQAGDHDDTHALVHPEPFGLGGVLVAGGPTPAMVVRRSPAEDSGARGTRPPDDGDAWRSPAPCERRNGGSTADSSCGRSLPSSAPSRLPKNSRAAWWPAFFRSSLRAATSRIDAMSRPGRTGITSSRMETPRMTWWRSSRPRRSYSVSLDHSTSLTTTSMRLRSRMAVTPNRSLMFRMPRPRTSRW